MTNETPFSASRLGTVGKLADGRSFVHFERQLHHPIEKVWAAIVDESQRANWFPGFEVELRQGGEFRMWFGGDCDGPAHVTGTVVELDPPNVLQCGSMRWELESNDAGCLLTFTDILYFEGPRSKAEITNSVLAGWHAMLDGFEQALAGEIVRHDRIEVDYSKLEISGRE